MDLTDDAPPPAAPAATTLTLGNGLRDCYEPALPTRLYVSLWMENAARDFARVRGNAYMPITLRVNDEPREVYMDWVTYTWLAGRSVQPTSDWCLTSEPPPANAPPGAEPRVFYRLRITQLEVSAGPPVEAPPGYAPAITTDFGTFLRSVLATGLSSSLPPPPPPVELPS